MTDASRGQVGGGAGGSLRGRVAALRSSDIGRASGLAIAMIVTNVVALGSTVVFARLLDDYGSLAALISFYLILSVVGQAMQVATARDAVLGQLGEGPALAATLRDWTRSLLLLTVGVAVVSVALRAPIADAVGVDQEWGAAVGPPAGVLWLLVSLLRGGLQGTGDYRAVGISLVGEQGARLVLGAALAAAGLGVTGAFLGTPLSMLAIAVYCGVELRHVTSPAGPLGEGRTPHPQAIKRGARPPPARPRRERNRADRRARDRLAAAERRHHRRQAPLLDRRRELLRRDRRRREGARVGRDGRRLLPRAGDLAPPRRRRGHAPRARERDRDRARLRAAGAGDLRLRRQTAAAGGVRRGPPAGSRRADAARHRLHPARGDLPRDPVPAGAAPHRVPASARRDRAGRAGAAADRRTRQPRRLRRGGAGDPGAAAVIALGLAFARGNVPRPTR